MADLDGMNRSLPEFVSIGRITKAHGVHGKIRVESFVSDLKQFSAVRNVYLKKHNQTRIACQIESVQISPKFVILSLEGFSTWEDADTWKNADVEIHRQEILPLPQDSYYDFELVGLEVVSDKGIFIGILDDILKCPANDVFVVKKDKEEFLIPDIPDVIKEIDIPSGKMIITIIDGLLE